MSASPASPVANTRRVERFAVACFVLVIACAIGELLGGLGHRFGWWGIGAGIQTVRWSATVDWVAVVLALIALVWAWRRAAKPALRFAAAALAIGLVAGIPPVHMLRLARTLPPLRQGARNPVEYDPAVAAQQRSGYPDLAPVRLDLPPAKAFEAAERSARAMGWDIVAVAPQDGRIEATDTTLLFGFKDDVVIRVGPNGDGTKLDVRSLSRVGGSDIGANAKRIRRFQQHLADEAATR
jgi:uncharacterized protein (DUF1499 family)